MNNKFYFKSFSNNEGVPIDIGIDFGNNTLKASYRIGNDKIDDYTPPPEQLNSYNRSSTVFLSFDINKEKVKSLVKKEVFEASGKKVMKLDPSDLDIYFDFGEIIQKPNQVFRCIKSQYYEGVLNKKSEFFSKVVENDGGVYRYFILGEIDGITLIINTNLLFDKLYVLCIETVLKDIVPKLTNINPTKLAIRVFSSIPLGASPQLYNDDEKVENYLNKSLSNLVFERIMHAREFGKAELVFRGVNDVASVKCSVNSIELIQVKAEIRFKTMYELLSPLVKFLKTNMDERVLLVIKDIGSLTNQTMFVYIDKTRKIIKPFNLDSFYGGGLSLNEEIIKKYCELKKLNPNEYFWDNITNCFRNFKVLEDLKKQFLFNKHFLFRESIFYGKILKENHKIDLKTLRSIVLSFYPGSVEHKIKKYIKNELERFVEHSSGNVKVYLMGEAFNQRSEIFNGVNIFLRSLGLEFLEKEPWNVKHTVELNYIPRTMLNSLNYRMNYTLYDNIAVVSEFKGEKFMVFTSSKVGEVAEFLINPIKDGDAEYIMVFTYIRYTQNRMNFDDLGKSVFGMLKAKLNTKFVVSGWEYVEGEFEKLKKAKPASFQKPDSPFYMIPLFKIKLYRKDKGIPVKLILRFLNTFEVDLEVIEKSEVSILRTVLKYPLLLGKGFLEYDYFNGVGKKFERNMFSMLCFKNEKSIEEYLPKKEEDFKFIFPKSRVVDLDEDDSDDSDDSDVEMREKKKKKKKKKRGKKRKRDEEKDDDEDEPKKKKRKKNKKKKKKKKKKKRKISVMKCCGMPRKGHPVGSCSSIERKEDKDETQIIIPVVADEDFILDEEDDVKSETSVELINDTEQIKEMIREEQEREENQKGDKMDLSDDGGGEINDENDFRPDTPPIDDEYLPGFPNVKTDFLPSQPQLSPPPPPQQQQPQQPQKNSMGFNTIGIKSLQNTHFAQFGGKGLSPHIGIGGLDGRFDKIISPNQNIVEDDEDEDEDEEEDKDKDKDVIMDEK